MTRCKHGETVQDMKAVLAPIDYLFLNEEEGRLLTRADKPEDIASSLRQCGVKHVIVKLGANGCFIDSDELKGHFKAYQTNRVLDTTGAGDTFAGAFLHALGQNMTLEKCLNYANAAASLCIERRGCASDKLDEAEIIQRMQ